MRRYRSLALAALALPLALTTASFAQPAPPPDGPPGMRMHHFDPAAMAQKHAQMLRDVLQLRPDQEGALSALMDSMKPPEGMRDRMGHGPMGDHDAGLTTPQRLDRMLAHMDERRGMMVRRIEAVKRFYGQLSPSQQKAFDALPPGHGMGGHGMGGGHDKMFMRHMGPGHPGMGGPGMDGPEHDAPDGHSPG
jgi:protein CpxP